MVVAGGAEVRISLGTGPRPAVGWIFDDGTITGWMVVEVVGSGCIDVWKVDEVVVVRIEVEMKTGGIDVVVCMGGLVVVV